jgi:hypothetical protein
VKSVSKWFSSSLPPFFLPIPITSFSSKKACKEGKREVRREKITYSPTSLIAIEGASVCGREVPVFAVQRLDSGRWVVRAPVEDPLLPAVVAVTEVDEGECSSWLAGPVAEDESGCP